MAYLIQCPKCGKPAPQPDRKITGSPAFMAAANRHNVAERPPGHCKCPRDINNELLNA